MLVLRRLTLRPKNHPTKAANGAPKLYLICDPKDEANLETLEDYLFDQGLEVSLPAFDGDDADAAALHQENVMTCDAVLVEVRREDADPWNGLVRLDNRMIGYQLTIVSQAVPSA